MDINLTRRVAELIRQRMDLKDKCSELQKEIDQLSEVLIEQFREDGIKNQKIELTDGSVCTVYPHMIERIGIPKDVQKPAVAAALVAAGLGDFVKEDFNLNSLSAEMRERRENGEDLPQAILDMVEVRVDASIRAPRI